MKLRTRSNLKERKILAPRLESSISIQNFSLQRVVYVVCSGWSCVSKPCVPLFIDPLCVCRLFSTWILQVAILHLCLLLPPLCPIVFLFTIPLSRLCMLPSSQRNHYFSDLYIAPPFLPVQPLTCFKKANILLINKDYHRLFKLQFHFKLKSSSSILSLALPFFSLFSSWLCTAHLCLEKGKFIPLIIGLSLPLPISFTSKSFVNLLLVLSLALPLSLSCSHLTHSCIMQQLATCICLEEDNKSNFSLIEITPWPFGQSRDHWACSCFDWKRKYI